MRNQDDLALMWEAATLYYEKKYTQQEIAGLMDLSRQTVSKLLNDAVKENIVQITIRDPQKDCRDLEDALCRTFGISGAVVCAVSKKNPTLCKLMTVKAAVGYLLPLLKEGNQKIAVSWGRTINDLINQLPEIQTTGNLVFPLFGATDVEDICFSSNEIARSLADKTGSDAQFAWFPYLTESAQDHILLKKNRVLQKNRSALAADRPGTGRHRQHRYRNDVWRHYRLPSGCFQHHRRHRHPFL